MSGTAKLKMNVKIGGDLSMPQVHTDIMSIGDSCPLGGVFEVSPSVHCIMHVHALAYFTVCLFVCFSFVRVFVFTAGGWC